MKGPKMKEIVPGLFQGSHPRTLPPNGIQAILNVDFTDAKYETKKLEGYTHKPILDGRDPGEGWLRDAVDTIQRYVENGWRTYVHCQAGISRSVFITAAYLVREKGMTPKEAVSLINSKTKIADPAPAYLLALEKLYKQLQPKE